LDPSPDWKAWVGGRGTRDVQKHADFCQFVQGGHMQVIEGFLFRLVLQIDVNIVAIEPKFCAPYVNCGFELELQLSLTSNYLD
jgi:hypothetical protein